MSRPLAAIAFLATASVAAMGLAASAPHPSPALAAAIASPTRTPANVARDRYRHPAETLAFFGIRPDQTVVEFLPAGGWYTEILAPLVKARGHYVALVPTASVDRTRTALSAKYGPIEVGGIDPATGASTVPAASADAVLTFRNVHNLLMEADPLAAPRTFRAFYAMLKPGGTLGVEDHRLPETTDAARERTTGYVKRSTVIRLATAAGFRLAGESAVNANPLDDHDHPQGVWTLPPTYQLGQTDRAKYAAIGESDRLTLRFVKPR